MSKRNGKAFIHNNIPKPSAPDDVMLCQKVEEGFLTVCATHEKQMNGEKLSIPPSLDKDFLRWRQMAVRYKSGDYRHTEAELKSLQVIAQWTVDVNQALRGQKGTKRVEWKD